MRVAVVGHVEWVTFARVAHVPAAGEIVHARESWEQAAGGGAVAAMEMARLVHDGGGGGGGDDGHAAFYTAVGEGDAGRRAAAALGALGLEVHAAERAEPHPRVLTFIDDAGERAITVLAPPLAPRGDDALEWGALDGADAVYFCKGDAAALREARRARVLVATARALAVLRQARVRVDVLVRSARDSGERYVAGELDPAPGAVVATEGAEGGFYDTAAGARGRWRAAPAPSPVADTYGAGDTFAAALAFGLGEGRPLVAALAFAASRGALALGRHGAGR